MTAAPRPRYLGLAIAAGLILLVSVAVFKRYLPYTGRSLMPKEPPAVVLAMENVHLVGLSKTKKLWTANAKKVEIGRNKSITTVTDITDGEIFDQEEVALRVQAGRARYNSRGSILEMSDGILVTGNEGQRVSATSAVWDAARSKLESKGNVALEISGVKASTDKLLVDLETKEVSMWNVRMAFDVKELEKRLDQEARPDENRNEN